MIKTFPKTYRIWLKSKVYLSCASLISTQRPAQSIRDITWL